MGSRARPFLTSPVLVLTRPHLFISSRVQYAKYKEDSSSVPLVEVVDCTFFIFLLTQTNI